MPEASKDEIRARNDIVEVISSYVTLTKAGSRLKGVCPFHQEKTPSFTVNPEKQVWHCFGCHEGGDVFTFIQRIEKASFPEAAERLATRVGLTLEKSAGSQQERTRRQQILEANALASEYYHSLLLKDPRGKLGMDFWLKRGVELPIIEKLRLGMAPDSWDSLMTYLRQKRVPPEIAEAAGLIRRRNQGEGAYDYFRNRLIVPIRNVQGQVIAFGGRTMGEDPAKYINSPESETFSKGKVLFGLDAAARKISAEDAAILVEGYMDQIALYQFGFEHCVATMGTAVTDDHLRSLSRYTRNLYVAFDADSAGMNAVLRSVGLFEEHDMKVRIVEVPEGLDPDDFVRQRGAPALEESLRESLSLVDFRIRQITRQFSKGQARQQGQAGAWDRSEMVRAVVPVVLEVRSPVQREALIARLAQEWCSPDLHRVAAAERAIRQEIESARRQRGYAAHNELGRTGGGPEVGEHRRSRSQQQSPSNDRAKPGAPGPSLESTYGFHPPGLVRAEREILAAILQEIISPEWLEQLPPSRFVEESDRLIAEWVFQKWNAGEELRGDQWMGKLVDEGGGQETESAPKANIGSLLSELLVQDVKYLEVNGSVEDRVSKVLSHWRKMELKQSRDAIARKIDAGESVLPEERERVRGVPLETGTA